MSEERVAIDETTAIDGLGLTKNHALQRAIVREVAERWRHERFGPPHRETDLPALRETHERRA